MGLIQERLGYLLRFVEPEEIRANTGIPMAYLNPIMDDTTKIEPVVRRNTYNYFNRFIYAQLRAVGATAVEARRYRNKSVAVIEARLGMRSNLIDDLAKARFETYKQFLLKNGRYVSEEATFQSLKESIAKAMGKSPKPPSHFDYDSYPTATHHLDDPDV